MRKQIRERMGAFVNLAPGEESTAFFASDLTREHLREVVRLFVATGPSDHPVPFARQGPGSINLLVFAVLVSSFSRWWGTLAAPRSQLVHQPLGRLP